MNKQDISHFKKSYNLSQKSKVYQFQHNFEAVVKYLFFTRVCRALSFPIKARAKLFNNKYLYGKFPDPSFSYLYLYGFNEPKITQMLLKYLKPGMVFMDIGAHVGYESMIAADLVQSGEVYCFEPTPNTSRLLMETMKDQHNVFCFNLAVGETNKTAELTDFGDSYSSCNTFKKGRVPKNLIESKKYKKIRVKMISMDDFCELFNIKPNLIKIDAEDYEFEILQGMKRIITSFKPKLILEIGDNPDLKVSLTKKIIKYMENKGYIAYEWEGDKIVKHKTRKEYKLIYENLIFIANEKNK